MLVTDLAVNEDEGAAGDRGGDPGRVRVLAVPPCRHTGVTPSHRLATTDLYTFELEQSFGADLTGAQKPPDQPCKVYGGLLDCNLLTVWSCEPGTYHRQPFSSVASSIANQKPNRRSGSV